MKSSQDYSKKDPLVKAIYNILASEKITEETTELEESLSRQELAVISKVEKMLTEISGVASDLTAGHETVKKFKMSINNQDVAVFKKAAEQIKSFILSRAEVSTIKKLANPADNREKKAFAVLEKMIKELPSMYDRVNDSWDDLDRYGANIEQEERAKLAKTVKDFSSFVLPPTDIELVKKTLNDAVKVAENTLWQEGALSLPNEKELAMAITQLNFLCYASTEIRNHLMNGEGFPEWFQNKLSGLHNSMEDLHSYIAGKGSEPKL